MCVTPHLLSSSAPVLGGRQTTLRKTNTLYLWTLHFFYLKCYEQASSEKDVPRTVPL